MVGIHLRVALLGHGNWLHSASVGTVKWFSNVTESNQLIECETLRGSSSSGVCSLLPFSHSYRCVLASQVVLMSFSPDTTQVEYLFICLWVI